MRNIKEKQIVELMKDGWILNPNTNYNGRKILSWYLGKRGEKEEYHFTNKTRNLLVEKGIIDTNDQLIKK